MEKINYLNIGNDVRIKRSDDRNLEMEIKKLVKSHPNAHQKTYKETEKWVFQGFYSTLESALTRIIDEKTTFALDSKNVNGIKDLIATVDSVKNEVIAAVKNSGITIESFKKQEDGRGRKKGVSVTVAEIKDKKVAKKKTAKKVKRKTARK